MSGVEQMFQLWHQRSILHTSHFSHKVPTIMQICSNDFHVFLLLRKASNCWLWLCYKNYCVCMIIVLSEKLNSSPLILGCADIRLSSLHSSASSHQAVWVKLKNSKLKSVNDKIKSLKSREISSAEDMESWLTK